MTTRSTSRSRRMTHRFLPLALLGTAATLLALPSTAQADHPGARRFNKPRVVVPTHTCNVNTCNMSNCDMHMPRTHTCNVNAPQYVFGHRAGTQRAWSDGRMDALYGRRAQPRPRVGLHPYSIPYRHGFKAGYRDTYQRGYAAGLNGRRQSSSCYTNGYRPGFSWRWTIR